MRLGLRVHTPGRQLLALETHRVMGHGTWTPCISPALLSFYFASLSYATLFLKDGTMKLSSSHEEIQMFLVEPESEMSSQVTLETSRT